MAALGAPPPPPPPPGAGPPPAAPESRRRGVALIAAGVAVVLVAAGVAGFLLLRPDEAGSASVTDPATSTATSAVQIPSTDQSAATPGSTSAGGQVPGAPAPGPAGSSVRTTPTSAGTTPFVPVPTGATADCSAPSSVDAAGATQTYEPAKAFDGKKETAWRCSGDASGKTIVINFGAPVQLTSVGLIPGFDKIDATDGSDRFVQSRKIIRVRWTFDDGTSVESTPNGERAMKTTPVSVRTATVRMTIEQTVPGSTVVNNKGESLAALDTTAVSEIGFAGVR